MSHTVTATVPTPMYDPRHPVFVYEPSTLPNARRQNGEAGRTISVVARSLPVAMELAEVLGRVLDNLTIDGKPVP